MIRWNLTIPEETDRSVRTYLARNGGSKGDLSRFVDEAVHHRVLELTVIQVKERNVAYDQQDLLDLVDEEVTPARVGRSWSPYPDRRLHHQGPRRTGCIRRGCVARSSS